MSRKNKIKCPTNPVLESVLEDPANQSCADCGARGPRWASVNLGVLFCIDCSGHHRNLGVHITIVKSATLDKWQDGWIHKVKSIGNRIANDYYEHSLDPSRKPTTGDSPETLSSFIRAKYDRKQFAPRSAPSPSELLDRGQEYDVYSKSTILSRDSIKKEKKEKKEKKDRKEKKEDSELLPLPKKSEIIFTPSEKDKFSVNWATSSTSAGAGAAHQQQQHTPSTSNPVDLLNMGDDLFGSFVGSSDATNTTTTGLGGASPADDIGFDPFAAPSNVPAINTPDPFSPAITPPNFDAQGPRIDIGSSLEGQGQQQQSGQNPNFALNAMGMQGSAPSSSPPFPSAQQPKLSWGSGFSFTNVGGGPMYGNTGGGAMGMPGGMPGGMLPSIHGMSGGMPDMQGMPGSMPIMPGSMPIMSGGMQGMSGGMQWMPGGLSGGMSGGLQGGISSMPSLGSAMPDMQGAMSGMSLPSMQGMQGGMSGGMPGSISGGMSSGMPNSMMSSISQQQQQQQGVQNNINTVESMFNSLNKNFDNLTITSPCENPSTLRAPSPEAPENSAEEPNANSLEFDAFASFSNKVA